MDVFSVGHEAERMHKQLWREVAYCKGLDIKII
jgi:hypothetical protein